MPKRFLNAKLKNSLARLRAARPESSWWGCLNNDLKAFGIPVEGWIDLVADTVGWGKTAIWSGLLSVDKWYRETRKSGSHSNLQSSAKRTTASCEGVGSGGAYGSVDDKYCVQVQIGHH